VDTNEVREALTALLEKLGGNESPAQSGTKVTVTDRDGRDVTLDLACVTAGTLVTLGVGEYMNLMDDSWIKYDGEKVSSEALASRIREAQKDDLSTILVHML
jgi:hypothetical protein